MPARQSRFVAVLATVSLLSASPLASLAIRPSGETMPAEAKRLLRSDEAGCRITITARNEGPGLVTIKMRESRSGYRAGVLSPDAYPDVWSPMNGEADWQIAPNGTATSTQVELPQPCGAGSRKTEFRYEFVIAKAGTQKTVKFPANNEFSSATTIALGNVARHF